MEYILNQLKKALRSMVVATILILVFWGGLYHLTNWETVTNYFWTGVAVCAMNTLIANLRKRRLENLLHVSFHWIVMAGVVLVLYHAGFVAAAVFAAAAIFASPFFGMSLYEGIVGFTLLVTLAQLMS